MLVKPAGWFFIRSVVKTWVIAGVTCPLRHNKNCVYIYRPCGTLQQAAGSLLPATSGYLLT